MPSSLFERLAGVLGAAKRRLIDPAPEPPAYWNAWARLDLIEAFEEETMAQIDDLRAVTARQTAVITGLMEMIDRVNSVNQDLAGQLAALSPSDPAAIQATLDAAAAAAAAGEAKLAPPAA